MSGKTSKTNRNTKQGHEWQSPQIKMIKMVKISCPKQETVVKLGKDGKKSIKVN